jgi:hypothetical protein
MNAPIATARTQDDLIEALRLAKGQRGLSNEFCDERGGLTRGHTDKVLGPTRAKSLSPMTLDLFLELFAVQILLVPNPEAEERMRERWEGRDTSNVRTGSNKVSKQVIERAKPHVLRDFSASGNAARHSKLPATHRTEIARNASRARWKMSGLKQTKKARKKRAWYRRTVEERKLQQPVQIESGASG